MVEVRTFHMEIELATIHSVEKPIKSLTSMQVAKMHQDNTVGTQSRGRKFSDIASMIPEDRTWTPFSKEVGWSNIVRRRELAF